MPDPADGHDPTLGPYPRFSAGDRVCVQLTEAQGADLPPPVVSTYLKFGTVRGVSVDAPRPRYWVKLDDGGERKLLSETQLEPAGEIVESN